MRSPTASNIPRARRQFLTVREMCVFAMFAALMFATTIAMAALPNIHLLGMFIVLLTVVYRAKALIPLYLFVLIDGLFYGFAVWWLPYLYVWTVLWAAVMLLPKNMPRTVCMIVYPVVAALHGFAFGALYAPGQAILYHYTFEQMLAWIALGFFPADVLHGAGNFAFGFLVYPLSRLLLKLERKQF